MNSVEKVPFREKGWEACLSPVYQMFSPLTICNLFDFCSISLSQRLSCKPVLIGIIAFLSWIMLTSSYRSALSMLSEGDWRNIFGSAARYSKKYFEKSDQGKSKRSDMYLQQSQSSLNSVETTCSLWEGLC